MDKSTSSSKQHTSSSEGSYITGAFGALLGASLGGLCWIFVHYTGFMAGFLGFIIAAFATILYNQFHGKNGIGKLIILSIALIYGIFFGVFISEIFQFAFMILTKEHYPFTLGSIPRLLSELHTNKDYINSITGDIIQAIVLGILGLSTTYRNPNFDFSKKKTSLR